MFSWSIYYAVLGEIVFCCFFDDDRNPFWALGCSMINDVFLLQTDFWTFLCLCDVLCPLLFCWSLTAVLTNENQQQNHPQTANPKSKQISH